MGHQLICIATMSSWLQTVYILPLEVLPVEVSAGAGGRGEATNLTFEQLIINLLDPYVANPNALLNAIATIANPNSGERLGLALNASHCQLYMVCDYITNHRSRPPRAGRVTDHMHLTAFWQAYGNLKF